MNPMDARKMRIKIDLFNWNINDGFNWEENQD